MQVHIVLLHICNDTCSVVQVVATARAEGTFCESACGAFVHLVTCDVVQVVAAARAEAARVAGAGAARKLAQARLLPRLAKRLWGCRRSCWLWLLALLLGRRRPRQCGGRRHWSIMLQLSLRMDLLCCR